MYAKICGERAAKSAQKTQSGADVFEKLGLLAFSESTENLLFRSEKGRQHLELPDDNQR